jgi:hypothetical protein
MLDDAEIDDPKIRKTVEGNVVRVDFGAKQ